MNNPDIIIIDDEPQIRRLLEITLSKEGYKVLSADTAKSGIQMATSHAPKLILLDLGLPDMNGHEVLKVLRSWYDRAIIILSVQNAEEDIVKALDNGATDYLSKPFRNAELLARIRSAMRKAGDDKNQRVFDLENLFIDFNAHVVKKSGTIVKLTSTEYNLLALFARNRGCVMTHQFILKEIWGVAYQNETQYLRVFVGTLRKKIENDPNNPEYIITESGVGYRFA